MSGANRYLGELRHNEEPTGRALLMARAVRQHVRDLLDDDPGDVNHDDVLTGALAHADALVTSLKTLLR